MKSVSICLAFVAIVLVAASVDAKKDRIKLKDLQVLTLRPGVWTTGRRSAPVPQLKCVGGHCDAIKGQTVQCYNRGSDGTDIQWECKTQIDANYKFGALDVLCEGYDYPNDDYVLVGSCGLEYTIDGDDRKSQQSWTSDHVYSHLKSRPSTGFSFGFVITVGIIIFIIYYTCLRTNTPDGDRQRRAAGGPPPPPGFRSDHFDGNDGSSGYGGGCGGSSTGSAGFSGFTYERQNPRYANANAGGNGWFTGALAGGALGYLFGSRNNANYRDQSSYFDRHSRPYTSTPRGFSSGSSSSGSTTTTTTTGFGGTKRR